MQAHRLTPLFLSAYASWLNPIEKLWPGYSIDYRFGDTRYHIHVENPSGSYRAVSRLVVDGQSILEHEIILRDDGEEHEVVITLG